MHADGDDARLATMLTELYLPAERHEEAVGLLHALLGTIGYTSWEEPSRFSVSTVFEHQTNSNSTRITVWPSREDHSVSGSACSLSFRAGSLVELEEAARAATSIDAAQVGEISRDRDGVSTLGVFLPSFAHVSLVYDPRPKRR
jgi:hypothetical protein